MRNTVLVLSWWVLRSLVLSSLVLSFTLAACGDDSGAPNPDLSMNVDLAPLCNPKPYAFTKSTAVSFAAMTGPAYLVAADFNSDHKLDFAVSNYKTSAVAVLSGNGDGTFAAPDSYSVGAAATHDAQGLGAADFTGDGVLDLIVANSASNTLTLLKGTSTGKFAAIASAIPTEAMPEGLLIADFNKDTKADVALALGDFTLDVLLGDGAGGFGAPLHSATELAAVGDFNHDGKVDIAGGAFSTLDMANGRSANIVLGNGDGSFTLPGASYPVGSGPDGVAVGDFNSDQRLDLIVTGFYDNTATVLLGNGDGTFTAGVTLTTGNQPDGLAVGNLDCDDNLDLVVSNGDNSVSVFRGNGDGTFAAAAAFPGGTGPGATVIADFNGDGANDILVTNYEGDTVTLLTNTP